MKYCLLLAILLTACTNQVDAVGRLVYAYDEGYEWAKTHAPVDKLQCLGNPNMSHYEKMLSKGCLKYIENHPDAERVTLPDSPALVRESTLDQPIIKPALAVDDFDWGYEWAKSENISQMDICAETERSDTYIAGCEQYVQDLIDIETND